MLPNAVKMLVNFFLTYYSIHLLYIVTNPPTTNTSTINLVTREKFIPIVKTPYNDNGVITIYSIL